MDPVVKANFMLLFSVENMAKARAEGDLNHKKELEADAAQAKADLEGKPEDDERSDDSQRTSAWEVRESNPEHAYMHPRGLPP
jgi:hypothetical protein